VAAQVDERDGPGDARDQRVDELAVVPDEREDRAVVVRVAVDVEQPGRRGEPIAQRRDPPRVAALGDVRHRLERKRHARRIRG
jgi:hypothetical protein